MTGLRPGDFLVSATFELEGQDRRASGALHIPNDATEATLDLDFHLGDLTLTVRSTDPHNALNLALSSTDGSSLLECLYTEDHACYFPHLRQGTYRLSYQKPTLRQDQTVELTGNQELMIDPNGP